MDRSSSGIFIGDLGDGLILFVRAGAGYRQKEFHTTWGRRSDVVRFKIAGNED